MIPEICIFVGKGESPSGAIEFRGRRRSIFNYDKRCHAVLDFHGIDISLERSKRRDQTWRNYIYI